MPQITKTREVTPGCYVVVQFTCPPELKRWDEHLFKFYKQASALYFDEDKTPPAALFPDGDLCYNRVTKTIDSFKCVFDFFLVSSNRVSLTFEKLAKGTQPPDVEIYYP
jgi:hypothetical protein